jgi:hypothetical protein
LVELNSILLTAATAGIFVLLAMYLPPISKDLRLMRTLLAAFMEQRVAGTVADNRLAAAVQEASKTPVGVTR